MAFGTTYTRRGESESINAALAREEGKSRHTEWVALAGLSVQDVRVIWARAWEAAEAADDYDTMELLESDRPEWHHVAKNAAEVVFCTADQVKAIKPYAGAIKAEKRAAAKAAQAESKTAIYQIDWTEWYGTGRRKSRWDRSYTGPATIKGNWIEFAFVAQNGSSCTIRKNVTGNWITVTAI